MSDASELAIDGVAAEPAIDGVAVIGMALRFPGADTPGAFWQNLCAGVESRREFSASELEASGVDRALLADPRYVRAGMPIDGIDLFDAAFFGLSPREAEVLDPQHRLFLEVAWEALEAAGYDPAQFPGAIGMFGGVFLSTYLHHNLLPNREVLRELGELTIRHGNEKDYVATRTSYRLNLTGPSVAVQTACSTGLVAVHLACQSLLNHECDLALAGACSVRVPIRAGYLYETGGIASPDGHCRPFDAQAAGTVFGHGLGLVVLRRLPDALADGDRIQAVIRGTAINNDGAQKVGFTAPSVDGQSAVIAEALGVSGVDPEDIGYIEAHGTGTSLGDPIEIEALTQAFRARTEKRGFCLIGSVKANIGHLGTASGIAGLIKTVLTLERGQIPPSLHFASPNPKIDFAASPFVVNDRLRDWPATPAPRRAGLSSFGMGGTNAHAVLEEAPPARPGGPARPVQLLPLSARTEAALAARTAALSEHLRQAPDVDLPDIAFTLAVGRQGFERRRFLLCRDAADAAAALATEDPTRVFTGPAPARRRSVAFLFPGQGSQYPGMARGLYLEEAAFREAVDECFAILASRSGLDLRSLVYPDAVEEDTQLRQTAHAQPAIFVVAYGLARLLLSWGVRPQVMVGHSVGEYVAACLSGVMALPDALDLVAFRGRLMQSLPPGDMLAVPLPEAELRPLLSGGLALAAVNGPRLSVASGESAEIERLERQLAARGVTGRRLHTSHAFHSPMMDPILPAFRERLRGIALGAPEIPFLSNLTGREATADELTDPEYWVRHLRHTVRFGDSLGGLLADPDLALVEVGPGRTLSTFVRQHPGAVEGRVVVSSLRHPQDRTTDLDLLLTSLGRLWMAGVEVDWQAFYAGQERRRVELPTYPFERQRFWIEPRPEGTGQEGMAAMTAGDDRLWVPLWKQQPHAPLPRAAAAPPARWLVLAAPGDRLGERLAERLAALGPAPARVALGERFRAVGERAYEIDPQRPEDFATLLAELAAAGWEPDVAAYLAGREAAERNLASLTFLARALSGRGRPLELAVVTSGLCEVTEREEPRPEEATLLGACRALPGEHPELRCRVVDLDPEPGGDAGLLVDRLIAELGDPPPGRVVAYRGRSRWVEIFEPLRLPAEPATAPPLTEGPVVLLAGDRSEPAPTLAGWLARTVGPRLLLLDAAPGRSKEMPWREAVELGARVLSVESETDGGLGGAVARALAQGGRPGALFFLPERDPSAAPAGMPAAGRSFRSLAAALAPAEPDLLVLVDALAGQTAVGAFFAAVARQRSAAGHPTLALGWGGVEREEAEAALPRALGSTVPEVVLAPVAPPRLPPPGAAALAPAAGASAPEALSRHPRPPLGTPYLAPQSAAERRLVAIWQQGLGIDRIGIHDNFFELGGDSLLAIRIAEEVEKSFAVQITTATLFEGPTVASLAALVDTAETAATEEAPMAPIAESLEQGERRRERARLLSGAARRGHRAAEPIEDEAGYEQGER
jgi:acyl transferase domain-containing protein